MKMGLGSLGILVHNHSRDGGFTVNIRSLYVIALALSLFACKGKDEDSGVEAEGDGSTTEETGEELVAKCAGCHGGISLEGSGSAPSIPDAVPQLTDDALRDILSDGVGTMEAVVLNDAEEEVLFEYLRDEYGQYGGS